MRFTLLHVMMLVASVAGHGRLVDPPSRSSMWRYGFDTPHNYNDNELFCGGIGVQWNTNGGKCGVCGDPYNVPQPRPNEAGGKYAKGIIVKNYRKGQVIDVQVEITANHLGYFEFRICPNNNPKNIVSQDCLDKHVLTLPDGKSTKYYVQAEYLGLVHVPLKLPENLTCTQCVLQWQYTGGNNWGRCADGRQGLSCGPQETFRSCSDISVSDGAEMVSTEAPLERSTLSPTTKRDTTTRPRTTRKVFTTKTPPTTKKDNRKKKCNARAQKLNQVPGLQYWCESNCAMGHCPPDLCIC